jgi:hypothetical protein
MLAQFLMLSGNFKIIAKFFKSVLGISASKSMPKAPKKPHKMKFKVCFHPDTMVNSTTAIKDINVGDMLYDGSIVKAVFILLANDDEQFYKPFTDNTNLLITSQHKVFNNQKNRWVYVKDHPDFCEYVFSGKHPQIVYCLNTSTKRIRLGGHCFLDWDEIESDNVAFNWYNMYKAPPSQQIDALFDKRLVDLGNGCWHCINPFLKDDYDTYTETYLEQQRPQQ